MPRDKKIALVLGAGGARGLAHVGVLKILEKNDIKPDMVVGCSMGAAVGALYALGMSADDLEKEAANKRKRDIFRLIDISFPGKSLIKGNKVYRYIDEILHKKNFSDTRLPFYAVAASLRSGDVKIISEGSLAKAVQASVSVPGIFPPVELNGDILVDGGIIDPTPVDAAKEKGADMIIAVDLAMNENIRLKKMNIVSILMQTYEIVRTRAVSSMIGRTDKNTVIIKPQAGTAVESFRFTDIPKMIEKGEIAANKKIEAIKDLYKKRINY